MEPPLYRFIAPALFRINLPHGSDMQRSRECQSLPIETSEPNHEPSEPWVSQTAPIS